MLSTTTSTGTVTLAGNFTITEPIAMPPVCRVICEGATFFCGGMGPNDFVIDGGGWRCHLEGSLTITNAPNGVRWHTGSQRKNQTLGSSTLSGIHFAGVRGVALDLQCRSSVVVVERCLFDRVGKILVHRMADELILRNCIGRPASNPGVTPITLRLGRLIIDGGIYTPPANARDGAAMSWVELVDTPEFGNREKMLLVRGVRFGGEYGGMAVVTNRAEGRSEFPSAPGTCITVRDCNINNAPSRADAANDPRRVAPIVLLQKVPNSVVIDGCYGMARGHLVDFFPGVDGQQLLGRFSNNGVNNRLLLSLQRHNTIRPGEEAPPLLKPFVVGPHAAAPTKPMADESTSSGKSRVGEPAAPNPGS